MPIYEYQCKKCGHRFEKLHKSFSDARVKKCPQCGGGVEQLLSAPAAHFKGEGFYVTDYARKGSGKPDTGEGAPAAASKDGKEAKADGKSGAKSESKAETKSESKSETKSDKKQKK
jgi:putative FmdB family regulatory protein